MRMLKAISVSIFLAAAACGQAATPADADAQTAGALTDADRAAIMQTLDFRPDAAGMVENACGSRVTPQFAAADLGGEVGVAQLVVVPGGDTPTCYGDGPGAMMLVRREGDTFRLIYSNQGGFFVILPTETNGVHDIAHGGPGFQHPVFAWNGAEYARAGSIADGDMGEATFLP